MTAWASVWANPSIPPNAKCIVTLAGGVFTDLTLGSGAGLTFYPVGGYAMNPTGADVVLAIQDGNGVDLIPAGTAPGNTVVAAGQNWNMPDSFMKPIDVSAGPIKAKGDGLVVHMWGYLLS